MVYAGDSVAPGEQWREIPGQNVSALVLPTRFDYYVVAKSNSALDLLMKQADTLARRYLLEPTDAAWLILTGECPKPTYMSASLRSVEMLSLEKGSLTSDHLSRGVLTLTVEPWVSSDKVASYYREIQHSILHEAGCKHRTVEVFRFVVAHTEMDEAILKESPQWSRLCDLWNEEYPEGHRWHFSDFRDFRKSYTRGRDAIVFPLAE